MPETLNELVERWLKVQNHLDGLTMVAHMYGHLDWTQAIAQALLERQKLVEQIVALRKEG